MNQDSTSSARSRVYFIEAVGMDLINGPGAKPWSLLPKAHKAPYLGDARAAIEAMREPTEAMERAGDASGHFSMSDEDTRYHGREAASVFRQMIDAALTKEEGNG